MLSAPAAIPAMIEVSLPAGFAPAEATRVAVIATLVEISSDRPASSASAITGASPTHDTRSSSSNCGVALDHPSGSFTIGAFSARLDQDLCQPRFSLPRRHLPCPDPPKLADDQLPVHGSRLRVALECAPTSSVLDMSYTIAEVAGRSGLSADTLRYYEKIGLIEPPTRDPSGHRSYTEDDVAWVTFLLRLRSTGMPIRLMR